MMSAAIGELFRLVAQRNLLSILHYRHNTHHITELNLRYGSRVEWPHSPEEMSWHKEEIGFLHQFLGLTFKRFLGNPHSFQIVREENSLKKTNHYLHVIWPLKVSFHSIECPIGLRLDGRDGRLTPQNGVKQPRSISLRCSLGCPSICLPETKWVRSALDVRLINQSNCLPWIT